MELLMDVVFLSRFQFAMTIIFHFLFVPMSIGLGLIMAIAQTRAHRSQDPKDVAAAHFWIKIFTATFAVGVATGITMEFAFGTNWADYSRFVGDIFGAPLAAEALFAFFLESSFLGVLLFGRKKVSSRFYTVSAWLVWAGSCLSALWILIANSWMQTPAGYVVEDGRAVLTDFFAAAFNPSTIARYNHTVLSLLILGAFVAIAVGAYHMLKGKYPDFGKKTLKTGAAVALATCLLMGVAAHQQAVVVAENQPEKLAAMEGQWETSVADMALIGWVDEKGRQTFTISIPIKGLTSLLASGSTETVYPGLEEFGDNIAPVQITFQAYHLMVLLFGAIGIGLIVALVQAFKKKDGLSRGALRFLMFTPIFPFLAIQSGWVVTEVGRQPWIVWHELKTVDAISQAVSATELQITIVGFLLLYLLLLVAWLRIVFKFIKAGPVPVDPKDGE